MNLELRKLCDWLTAIKLTLNVKKLISSYFVQPKENLLSNLTFDNDKSICVSLERKVFARYIPRPLIDQHLTWKHHTLFLFYKNIFFLAQPEYSYFSADFRLVKCFVCWLVLPFRERNNFIQLSKNISLYCIYRFSTHEIIFFSQFQPQVYP